MQIMFVFAVQIHVILSNTRIIYNRCNVYTEYIDKNAWISKPNLANNVA